LVVDNGKQREALVVDRLAIGEVWWFGDADLYSDTGVRVLEGDVLPLSVGDSEISVVGFSVLDWPAALSRRDNYACAREVLAKAPEDRFRIMVHHFPEVAALGVEAGADLGLAGDTHGGQIRLPVLGPLVRILRLGGYFDVGLHRVGEGLLYVNRGIGMEGSWAPRVRFRCRPEVTLIEIVPKDR
ncbi:metallophosphoesterase, partial [Planctomycetota bacterium]